ncbi:MAG: cohesin domain-containing protein [Bacteroidales bacterium]|nr:cohesin domain-containing protein [Bacteroidales bacterium]
MKKRILFNTGQAGQCHLPTQRALFFLFLFTILFSGLLSISQPVVTVRFANPEYDCVTQIYTVDVEFQSDTPGEQLFGMNVFFNYNDNDVEFISFGEFVTGYGAVNPNPPEVTPGTAYAGGLLFGFDGPYEFINGAIQKIGTDSLILSTTSWTKIFNMSFLIDDPGSFNSSNFCPSLVWDLKEYPSQGGIINPGGIVITLVGSPNVVAIPNAVQFNWQYGGTPGFYGNPVETDCISTMCGIAPVTNLPLSFIMSPGFVDIPVSVTGFENITGFTLTFEYDPATMTFENYTAHAIFNGALVVTDAQSSGGMRKINLSYSGDAISLPDSSSLAVIQFDFITGETALNWLTDGVSCKYYGPGNVPLPDTPYPDFYYNGSVTLMLAPVTKIDSAFAKEGDYVTFPVRVWNYNNIQGGSLTLDFDTASLTYYNATPNAALNGSFSAQLLSSDRLGMSWSGNSVSLPDESVLVYVTFIYSGGVVPLVWFDDGASCQYICGNSGLPLYDIPFSTYYIDGNVAPAEFVWTGNYSGEWGNPANWLDNIVPDRFTNVTIDPSFSRSDYWPTFPGDFTLGVHCKNLFLNDNVQFIVTGNFTISPGHILEMGSGVLHIGGAWTNSGTFIPGTGTVRFNGPDLAEIAEGVSPASYIAAYILSTFEENMIPISGGNAGPTGDNAHSDVSIGFDFNFLGTVYSQVRINTNGWLSMNLSGDDASSFDNNLLFETFGPSTVLAPWWDDLLADGSSSISYITTGVAPERVFTVEWKDILTYSSGSTVRLNFQVRLYETTNVIDFCYGDKSGSTHNALEGASIGIKDAIGGPGNFLEATLNTTHIAFPCIRSEIDWPATNYRYTPPVENYTEIFHRVVVEKLNGELAIQKGTQVTGTN